jgi:NAD(P)-dependent dehydrogenase (short-subunit alcohol dehydrogenase family)
MKPAYDFNGKVAVVTGGGSGMGAASARLLAAAGASVVVVDINLAAAEAVAGELKQAVAVRADVTSESDVVAYVRAAVDAFGGIDLFHNNAGVLGRPSRLSDATLADYQTIFGINFLGCFLGIREVSKQMTAQGRGGAIVNTASIAGLRAVPNAGLYSASKFALIGLTRTAAKELGAAGIRVNAICPGATPTGFSAMSAETISNYSTMVPLGRLAIAADMADAAAWLLSDGAAFINGQVMAVDGGQTA